MEAGGIAQAYRWRGPLRVAGWAIVAAAGLLAIPLALFAIGIVAALAGVLLSLVELNTASSAVTAAYARSLDALFAPAVLPTIIPRLIVLCCLAALGALGAGLAHDAWRATNHRRAHRGTIWRLFGAPFSAGHIVDRAAAELWNLIRGAAAIAAPPRQDLGRRYVELLTENVGQPGFRELLLVTHDIDGRRDLVFALLGGDHRHRFFELRGQAGADGGRAAETFDLAGLGRDHLMDALAASLAIPVATNPHLVKFSAEGSVARGNTPGVRPAGRSRSPSRGSGGRRRRTGDCRLAGRATGQAARTEHRARRRARTRRRARFRRSTRPRCATPSTRRRAALPAFLSSGLPTTLSGFSISAVCYDERSDRRYTVAELVDRGYEDAYRQFIEPVVAASGERIQTVQS